MLKSNWIKMGLNIIKITIILFLLLISIVLLTRKANKTKVIIDNKNYVINALIEEDIPTTPIEEVVEEEKNTKYVIKDTFTGSLTGYAADCPACYGTLGCLPSYNVYKNGVVTYKDKTYGSVRIVASSKLLACGSIIRFNSNRVSNDDVYAIVLDRGVLNRNIDILVPTERYAYDYIGRSNITYDVLRYGW